MMILWIWKVFYILPKQLNNQSSTNSGLEIFTSVVKTNGFEFDDQILYQISIDNSSICW